MAARVTGAQPADAPHVPAPAGRVVDCAIYIDGMRQPGRLSYADAYAEVPRTPGARRIRAT